jgi:NADH-quinone oxidoreductase subunit J
MSFQVFVFYLLAGLMLFAAIRVVTSRNPVHSALFLVLAFVSCSGLWLLLEAEFLAIALVLVYVGAVMVLFLFVVMMLDINVDALRADFWRHFPLAALVGVVIALEMAAVLLGGFRLEASPAPDAAATRLGNTKLLGIEVYTHYLYPLQIAAVLLLVAIVAAIALTLRKRKDSRFLNPSQQVRVTKAQRLRIVRMPPVMQPPAAGAGLPEQVPKA